MKMIWAVVRSDKDQIVARRLKSIGVSGCTIYPDLGSGEEFRLYQPRIIGGHHKLEAIVDDDQVENAVKEITEHASTGLEGDGILSVFELDKVLHLRTKK